MNLKEVIARKDYDCIICSGVIRKGQRHNYETGKMPKFDKEDNQVGIEFYKHRTHLNGCWPTLTLMDIEDAKHVLRFCRKGKHEFIDEVIPTPDYYLDGSVYETGNIVCKWCGVQSDFLPAKQ